jgi:hypothetical protein
MEKKMRSLTCEELALVAGGCEEPQKCNNGWGNGENCAPGNSLEHQPKFEDPDTGPSPSNSPASGGGNR